MKNSNKNKKILILLAVAAAIILLLSVMPGFTTEPHEGPVGPDASYASEEGKTTGTLELEAFDNVELAVKSADLLIRTGDAYSLEYNLHSKEPVKRAEVVNGALHFETDFSFNFTTDYDEFYVILTIPADAPLNNLHLKTVAGDIELSGRSFQAGSLETTSGDVEADHLSCGPLSVFSVSGDVELDQCEVRELSVKTTSGDIELSGDYQKLDAKSVAGECELEGSVSEVSKLETTSGSIELTTTMTEIKANTRGTITYNGKDQGTSLNLAADEPMLSMQSMTGNIEINTP